MPPDVAELVRVVHAAVVADPGTEPTAARVGELVRRHVPLAPAAAVDRVVVDVLQRVAGLGPLEPLLADPEVSEVMVNGPAEPVWVERSGRLEPTALRLDRAAIELVVERVVAPLGRRADRTSPLVDARLPDGSRVNIVVPPLAVDGPCITIRRFGARAFPLETLAPPGVAALLRWAVGARCNIVALGGTGAGKTTLLNALAAAIPDDERIVTVEDAAELRLPHGHVVRLEARLGSAGQPGEITIRDLVRNALRMRPDRIVVGEVRGAEALDLLQAMNTGHEGALSTLHANNPGDALSRLETLTLLAGVGLPYDAIRRQVVASVDLLVHVARLPSGHRRVVEVAEVTADGSVRPLADGGGLRRLPERTPRVADVVPPERAWVAAR